MKIKSFRVKNYKSIVDSGNCYLERDMTIFAGKNESGKTSLLQALFDFNVDNIIAEDVVPIDKYKEDLEISVTFAIPQLEINKYLKSIKLEGNCQNDVEFTITKDYYDKYNTEDSIKKLFNIEDSFNKQLYNTEINGIRLVYDNLLETLSSLGEFANVIKINDIDEKNLGTVSAHLKNLLAEIEPKVELNAYYNVRSEYISLKAITLELLEQVVNTNVKVNEAETKLKNFLALIPNFVFFRSFEDIIPNSIPFSDIEKSDFIKDLQNVSHIDIDLILSKEQRRKIQHRENLNIHLNDDYSKYWTQDDTGLKIEWDSDTITFWIVEENELYTPSQRSKGKQWHLAFYLKTSARTIEGKTNVLLIDEPGLFLHASAQRDIYQRLLSTSLGQNIQVLFTTHSPYLIKSDELQRIRLVQKTNIVSGTKVNNKVYASADKETLTPILTAIGVELNQGIQNIDRINNLVVEGPGDLFYLNAFSHLIHDKEINFIFGGGSGNMGNVGTILSGWGCKVAYLFDNDQGKTNGGKNLRNTWLVKKELILAVTTISNGSIEDVLKPEEFKNFVLCDPSANISTTNSDYIKECSRAGIRIDKVLVARQFLSKVTNGEVLLSEATINHIKKLFEKMKNAIQNSNQMD